MARSSLTVDLRTAQVRDVPRLAEVQLDSALTAFARIFPESVAKPVADDLAAGWASLVTDPRASVLVAETSGLVVGGVAFGDVPELAPPGHGLLAKLYVHSAYFGAGVGAILHDAALSRMRDAGWPRLWLWVLEGNTTARRMYERRGWVAQPDRRTDWPGSGVYEMGYALELKPSTNGSVTRP